MYPRYFLTHHFWTLQQRSEFAVMDLRDRLLYNRNVFRHLQSDLRQVKNDEHYEQWKIILGKLGSGLHPTVQEIISVQKLFSEPPYKTTSLSYTHIVSLKTILSVLKHLQEKKIFSFLSNCRKIWPHCMALNRYFLRKRNSPIERCAFITSIWLLYVKVEQRI